MWTELQFIKLLYYYIQIIITSAKAILRWKPKLGQICEKMWKANFMKISNFREIEYHYPGRKVKYKVGNFLEVKVKGQRDDWRTAAIAY